MTSGEWNKLCNSATQETGEIRVAIGLDRETVPQYNLVAHAQDRDRSHWECSSELLVTLDDVNDNAPRFSADTYSVTLPEDADLGTIVTKVSYLLLPGLLLAPLYR